MAAVSPFSKQSFADKKRIAVLVTQYWANLSIHRPWVILLYAMVNLSPPSLRWTQQGGCRLQCNVLDQSLTMWYKTGGQQLNRQPSVDTHVIWVARHKVTRPILKFRPPGSLDYRTRHSHPIYLLNYMGCLMEFYQSSINIYENVFSKSSNFYIVLSPLQLGSRLGKRKRIYTDLWQNYAKYLARIEGVRLRWSKPNNDDKALVPSSSIRPLIYNIFSSIVKVFSLPSASFQNKSYWGSAFSYGITENVHVSSREDTFSLSRWAWY
jgi:hypothetical protein